MCEDVLGTCPFRTIIERVGRRLRCSLGGFCSLITGVAAPLNCLNFRSILEPPKQVSNGRETMEMMAAIRTRKSVRSFLDTPVDEATLNRVVEAARLAPSARNAQEWRFIAVRDKGMRERIAVEAARQPFIAKAAVLLACCAETDGRIMRCGQAAYPIDVAIAMDHLSLAAVAEGLGTCWIGAFDEKMVKDLLGIPPAMRVVQLMPLGWPADPAPAAKSRLAMDTILHRERW